MLRLMLAYTDPGSGSMLGGYLVTGAVILVIVAVMVIRRRRSASEEVR